MAVNIDQARLVESWTWYGACAFVVIFRMISRTLLRKGISDLQGEDWLMVFTFLLYTNFIVWVNIQAQHAMTNILPHGVLASRMSPQEIQHRTDGSIATFVVELNMCCIQWACKACVLLMFYRITAQTKIQYYVYLVMGYSFVGFVVTEALFFGFWCRPMSNYFRVFDGNTPGCTTSQNHLVISYVFNLSSDLMILVVPIPMFIKSALPLKKKVILWAVLSLGLFVCIGATMSRIYCFVYPESVLWIFWYVREASVAVIVANIPNCWTLLQKAVNLGPWSGTSRGTSVLHRYGISARWRGSRPSRSNDTGSANPHSKLRSESAAADPEKAGTGKHSDASTNEYESLELKHMEDTSALVTPRGDRPSEDGAASRSGSIEQPLTGTTTATVFADPRGRHSPVAFNMPTTAHSYGIWRQCDVHVEVQDSDRPATLLEPAAIAPPRRSGGGAPGLDFFHGSEARHHAFATVSRLETHGLGGIVK